MNTQDKGDHAELRIAAELKKHGWSVLFPYTESQQYDLVAEKDEFVRIQVKSSNCIGGAVKFHCYCSNSSKSGNNETQYTEDDIDGIAVFNEDTGKCYWIPVSDINRYSMTLSEDGKNSFSKYSFERRFS